MTDTPDTGLYRNAVLIILLVIAGNTTSGVGGPTLPSLVLKNAALLVALALIVRLGLKTLRDEVEMNV